MTTRLERAISRFRRRQMEAGAAARSNLQSPASNLKAAAFRAALEERLRNLERDVADLKGRLNGLIFVVLGAVITQVILKLVQ